VIRNEDVAVDLRTPRLRLRPYERADFDRLFEDLVLDPIVTQYWYDYAVPGLTVEDKRAMAEHDLGAWIEEGLAAGYPTWIVEVRDPALGTPGEFAGAAAVYPPENAWGPEPEVGILLAARHHGRGIATEALGAVIDDAAGRLGITAFAAIVDEPNAASIRLVEKLGFELDRMFAESDGRPCRRYVRRD
jgi:RimJ/RimL family protein N-acetyltransferase